MPLTSSRFARSYRLQAAALNNPAIRRGERGEPVAILQRAYVDIGQDLPNSTRSDGTLDGIFGGETKAATTAFQQKWRLTVDGVIGRQTLNTLDALFTRTPGGPPLPPFGPAGPVGPVVPSRTLPQPRRVQSLRRVNAVERNALANALTTDPAIDRIDFFIGRGERIHITGARLRHVADLIRKEKIRCYKSPSLRKADLGGEYNTKLNTLKFDLYDLLYINSQDERHRAKRLRFRSFLVHEATHAVIDLSRRRITLGRNEAAAYIAGHLYLLLHRTPLQWTSKHHKIAQRVVKEHNLTGKRGVRLYRNDIIELIKAIPWEDMERLYWRRQDGLNKLKKADALVKYGLLRRPSSKRCGTCDFFQESGGCDVVAGAISPNGICWLYEWEGALNL